MNLTAHLDNSDKQKRRFEDKSFNERKATRDEILKRFKSNVQSLTGFGDYSTADGSFMSKTLNKSFQNNPRLTTVLRSTFDSPNRITEATSNQRPKDERLWGLVQNFQQQEYEQEMDNAKASSQKKTNQLIQL